jgi:hypothetical protein
VAIAALVLSLATAIVGIVNAIRNRARLVVTLQHDSFTPSTRPHVFNVPFTVTVQNLGKTPLTVWDVGLGHAHDSRSASKRRAQIVVHNLEQRNPAGLDPKQFILSYGPTVPHQIPVGGVVDWIFEDHATASHGEDVLWHAYAVRLKGKRQIERRSAKCFTRGGVASGQ